MCIPLFSIAWTSHGPLLMVSRTILLLTKLSVIRKTVKFSITFFLRHLIFLIDLLLPQWSAKKLNQVFK